MTIDEFANEKLDIIIEQPDGWRERLDELEQKFAGK